MIHCDGADLCGEGLESEDGITDRHVERVEFWVARNVYPEGLVGAIRWSRRLANQ